jgi:hypothetical protein
VRGDLIWLGNFGAPKACFVVRRAVLLGTVAASVLLPARLALSSPQNGVWVGNGAPTADQWNQANNWSNTALPNDTAIFTTFEGEFSNVTHSYAGKGVVRYAW